MKATTATALFCLSLLLNACQYAPPETDGPVKAVLSVVPSADPALTKSAYSGAEDAVADWTLLQFEDGVLAAAYYQSSGSGLGTVRVVAGHVYDWYALANVGDISGLFEVGVTPESALASWRVSDVDMRTADALPMAWTSVTAHPEGLGFQAEEILSGAVLGVALTRLVARYDITVDGSGLLAWRFTAGNVLLEGPSDVCAFGTSMATGAVVTTDRASTADLTALNGGRPVTFYTPENRYGDLLPENTDPWRKKPQSLSPDEHPTYVEISGTAARRDGSGTTVPIKYRFYLGRDNCSNFDVVRNTVNTVTLVLTDASMEAAVDDVDKTLWKVEAGSYIDDRSVAWDDELLSVPNDVLMPEAIWTYPEGMALQLLLDQDALDAGVRVFADAEGTQEITPATCTQPVPLAAGTTMLYFFSQSWLQASGTALIRTLDGRKSDVLLLAVGPDTVRELTYVEVVVHRDFSSTIAVGDRTRVYLIAHYSDGYSECPNSWMVDWQAYDVSGSGVASVEPEGAYYFYMQVNGLNPGVSRITCTYRGFSDAVDVTVTAVPRYDYEFVRLWLDPGDVRLEPGGSVREVLKADYRWREDGGVWNEGTIVLDGGFLWSLSGDTGDAALSVDGVVENLNESGAEKTVYVLATMSENVTVACEYGTFVIPLGESVSSTVWLESDASAEYEYRVMLDPSSAVISAGGTATFTATLQRRPAGGSDAWSDLTSSAGDFVWSSSYPEAATVSGGAVTGCNDSFSSATTDISAEYFGSGYPEGRGQSAVAQITVNGKVLQSLYVPEAYARPFAPAIAVAFGDAIRFSCLAHYDYGADADVTDLAEWGTGPYLRHEGCVYTCSSIDRPTSGTATSFSVSYGGRSVTVAVTVYPKYVTALSVEFRDSFRVSENSKPRGELTWNDGSTATETAGGLDGYTVTDADDSSRVWTYESGDDVDMSELGPGTYVLTIRHTSLRYGSDHTLTASKTFTVGND